MSNMPELKIGVVAVSRDCFPESLSVTRRENLIKAYKKNMERRIFMSVQSVSWKVRSTWCRHWRTLKMQDVMHLLCILETSDRRSQRHCLQTF